MHSVQQPPSLDDCLLVIKENPEGVSWPNNPSFPLKGSVSEPEGEAWA